MFRLFLAALILATAALGPAAAFAPPPHAQTTAQANDRKCECCAEGQFGAAMACAALCHAALPSLMTASPPMPRAHLMLSFLTALADGVTREPPAPPPRL